jgi:hypothetical protein
MIKIFLDSTEITREMQKALDAPVVLNLTSGNSSTLEVWSEKPITKSFFSIASDHDGDLAVLYYNGSSYVGVYGLEDLTGKLTSDGWVRWTKSSDLAKDGDYYKTKFVIGTFGSTATASIRFIGSIFAEDSDLKTEYPNIYDYLPQGDVSHIRFHVAAKDAIVQFFRAKGQKTTSTDGTKHQLDEFDFLDTTEMRQAGKYMALAKIFFFLSDGVDDKWYQKGKDFLTNATSSMEIYYLSIDHDRDAEPDTAEVLQTTELRIIRA